jgi:hypothetical protein
MVCGDILSAGAISGSKCVDDLALFFEMFSQVRELVLKHVQDAQR